jgi:hypothetical protein
MAAHHDGIQASPPMDGSGEPMKYPVTERTMMASIVTQCQMRMPAVYTYTGPGCTPAGGMIASPKCPACTRAASGVEGRYFSLMTSLLSAP